MVGRKHNKHPVCKPKWVSHLIITSTYIHLKCNCDVGGREEQKCNVQELTMPCGKSKNNQTNKPLATGSY